MFGSVVDGSLGSSGFITHKQREQMQFEGSEIRFMTQKLHVRNLNSPGKSQDMDSHRFQGTFEHLTSSDSGGNALRLIAAGDCCCTSEFPGVNVGNCHRRF